MDFIFEFDTSIILLIKEYVNTPWLDSIMKFISFLGNAGIFWIVLGCLLTFYKAKKQTKVKNLLVKGFGENYNMSGAALLLAIAIGALIANILLKPTFARIRPYDALGLDIIIPPLHDYSFPSGHTVAAFASASAIYGYNKKSGIILYAFGGLMGLSRLYLLVHYPTDVFAGAVIGFLSGKIALYIIKKLEPKIKAD